MDFVGKPFVSQVLVSRVKRILENRQYQNHLEEMVASQVAEMTRMQDEVITGIANLIESRDGSTGLHVKNTQNYVQILTKALREKGMYPDILDHNYEPVSYTHLRAHETDSYLVCRLLLEKKKT